MIACFCGFPGSTEFRWTSDDHDGPNCFRCFGSAGLRMMVDVLTGMGAEWDTGCIQQTAV